jgi:hypothetical protein
MGFVLLFYKSWGKPMGRQVCLTMPYQIRAVYDEFEDPYSSFNYDQEYSNYFWSRFKKAVAEIKPDIILM